MTTNACLLTCVEIVVRCFDHLLGCQDACFRIEEFFDGPERWRRMSFSFPSGPTASESEALDMALQTAAKRGYLHITKWLHEYFPVRVGRDVQASVSVMNTAATNGHLEIVRFLHLNRSEGCSVKAMDGAATNGYLAVVEYLHIERAEGCTIKAMDGAARNNHVAVVKWLHSNRNEGCSSAAFDNAALRGDLKLLKFLHKHYGDVAGLTPNYMNHRRNWRYREALEDEQLQRWLRKHYMNVFTSLEVIPPVRTFTSPSRFIINYS